MFFGGVVQACSRWLAIGCAALSLWVAATGCSDVGPSATSTAGSDALSSRALSVFYQEFMSEHGGRPPQDEAEFREFLATRQERLDAGGLTADKILIGPHGEKWIVGYGKPIEIDGRRFVAYSATSVDAQRTAITERGGVDKFDEAMIPPRPSP